MSDFNRVFLMGNIGNDLELKTSATGKSYLRLSLATSSNRGTEKEATHWHRIIIFGTQAELCAKYLRKGSKAMIEGSLEVRTYTDKEGRKNTTVSVVAQRVKFMGGRMQAEAHPDNGEVLAPTDVEAATYAASA